MPVIGIESILCKDLFSFLPLILRSRPLIVDADDFLHYYRPIDRTSWLYGGEYLSMAVLWNTILDTFNHCDLDPLFIIGSHVERRGQQLKYQLKGMERVLGFLRCLHQGSVNNVPDEIHIPLARDALVDLLYTLNVNHLCSPYATHASCASLAHRMNCSLIASSPEYLLLCCKLEHQNYSGFDLIPLQCLNPIRFVVDETLKHYALSAHKFDANRSQLASVSSFYRPLLFGLLGSDLIPRIRLPKHLYDQMNKNTNINIGDDYKTRRWTTLLDWLKHFSPGSLRPFKEIAKCYIRDDVDDIWQTLAECLSTYLPDASVGSRLNSFLLTTPTNANQSEPNLPTPEANSVMRVSKTIDDDDGECWENKFKQMFFASSNQRTDFTANWPKYLVRLVYQSRLSSLIFAALYSTNSAVLLPQTVECLNLKYSVWDASLKIRLLHYRILYGLEKQLGNKDESKRQVREFVRRGENLHYITLQIQPINIQTGFTTFQQFCAQHFGLWLHGVNSYSDPLISLSVTLALWQLFRQQTSSENGSAILPSECSPIILAVLLCAVANHFNFETLDQELVKHYDQVCHSAQELATSTKNTSGSSQSNKQNIRPEYIHTFNSIQIIYSLLRSLIALLCELVPTKMSSNQLQFAPAWKVFPSGRLIHWLTGCLWIQEFTLRRHVAIRYWLPRLIKKRHDTESTTSIHKRAAELFNETLNLCSTIVCSSSAGGAEMKVNYTTSPFDPIDLDSMKPFVFPVGGSSIPPTVSTKLNEHLNYGQQQSTKKCRNVERPTNSPQVDHATHLKHECNSTPDNLGAHSKRERSISVKGKRDRTTGYAERLKERLKLVH